MGKIPPAGEMSAQRTKGGRRGLNKFLRSAAGRRRGLFQKFMKPAPLADAKKQSVAALALLAKAASVYTPALLADAVCRQTIHMKSSLLCERTLTREGVFSLISQPVQCDLVQISAPCRLVDAPVAEALQTEDRDYRIDKGIQCSDDVQDFLQFLFRKTNRQRLRKDSNLCA